MTAIQTFKKLAISAAATLTLGNVVFADHGGPDPYSTDFRESRPIRVHVDVDTKGERRERHLTAFESNAIKTLQQNLPHYIQLVDNRRRADMTVHARELDYSLDYRVTDRDREDKKYKKAYRHVGGRCGRFIRAYYTEVKEKAEAHARYDVRVTVRGLGRDTDHLRVKASEKFKYGTDLIARTNCGTAPTNYMPSNGVADLFAKASPAYRKHIAREVREETAEDLGRALAGKIRAHANDYYADMALRYARTPRHDDYHSQNGGDYGLSSEYSHRSPHPAAHDNKDHDREDEELGVAVLIAAGLAILAASQ